MTLEHLQPLAIPQADDVIRLDQLLAGTAVCGLTAVALPLGGRASLAPGRLHRSDSEVGVAPPCCAQHGQRRACGERDEVVGHLSCLRNGFNMQF